MGAGSRGPSGALHVPPRLLLPFVQRPTQDHQRRRAAVAVGGGGARGPAAVQGLGARAGGEDGQTRYRRRAEQAPPRGGKCEHPLGAAEYWCRWCRWGGRWVTGRQRSDGGRAACLTAVAAAAAAAAGDHCQAPGGGRAAGVSNTARAPTRRKFPAAGATAAATKAAAVEQRHRGHVLRGQHLAPHRASVHSQHWQHHLVARLGYVVGIRRVEMLVAALSPLAHPFMPCCA